MCLATTDELKWISAGVCTGSLFYWPLCVRCWKLSNPHRLNVWLFKICLKLNFSQKFPLPNFEKKNFFFLICTKKIQLYIFQLTIQIKSNFYFPLTKIVNIKCVINYKKLLSEILYVINEIEIILLVLLLQNRHYWQNNSHVHT